MLVLMAWSCADENPNLVNPPPQSAFINIRFYNLAGDGMGRVLDLEGEYKTAEVPVRNISTSFNPPTDSSFLKVRAKGIEEYSQFGTDEFIPYLSIIDVLMNCSPQKLISMFEIYEIN